MVRQYIVFAYDADRSDQMAFSVFADSTEKARSLVSDEYVFQGWVHGPLTMTTKLVKHKEGSPVHVLGHSMELSASFFDEQRKLCEKIMELADDSEYTHEHDALYAFLTQFSMGRELMAEKDIEWTQYQKLWQRGVQ